MTSPITAEQIAEWKALAEKATEGPWTTGQAGNLRVYGPDGSGVYSGPICEAIRTTQRPDISFIAASRTAVPALIAEVEKLRQALRKIERAQHSGDEIMVIETARAALPEEPAD